MVKNKLEWCLGVFEFFAHDIKQLTTFQTAASSTSLVQAFKKFFFYINPVGYCLNIYSISHYLPALYKFSGRDEHRLETTTELYTYLHVCRLQFHGTGAVSTLRSLVTLRHEGIVFRLNHIHSLQLKTLLSSQSPTSTHSPGYKMLLSLKLLSFKSGRVCNRTHGHSSPNWPVELSDQAN